MGNKQKRKGQSGAAKSYISRRQAMTKLQLSLKDFRRLCILKGIYPVEPKRKTKLSGNSANKTYYLMKDIQFLGHEPIIEKFRAFRHFIRRYKKAIGKNDREALERIKDRVPIYKLDHVVRERYPTFIDALRDLDDALSMCFLFATLPKSGVVETEVVDMCRRVTVEFMHYVIASKSLKKCFISIKGYYYQAEIQGQTVTWIVPHPLGFNPPCDVDFKIMYTFTEFYVTLLGFVNFRLFTTANMHYPPKLQNENFRDTDLLNGDDPVQEHLASLADRLKTVLPENTVEEAPLDEFPDEDDGLDEETRQKRRMDDEKFSKLFTGMKVFLNREVPREPFVFVLRSFGAEVSWDKYYAVGATFDEDDPSITHQIVDRPLPADHRMDRHYIQPQWVFDCVNARKLLPVADYIPGSILPPHLSPFVEEQEGDYVPIERELEKIQRCEDGNENESEEEEKDEEEDEDDEEDEEEESDGEESEDEEMPTNKNARKRSKSLKSQEPAKKRARKDDTDQASEKLSQKTADAAAKQSEDGKKAKKGRVSVGQPVVEDAEKLAAKQANEEKKLAVMMIPKKKKRLYDRIMYSKKQKAKEVRKLQEKRETIAREKQINSRKAGIKSNKGK